MTCSTISTANVRRGAAKGKKGTSYEPVIVLQQEVLLMLFCCCRRRRSRMPASTRRSMKSRFSKKPKIQHTPLCTHESSTITLRHVVDLASITTGST